jgi:hypothetical protein
MSESPEVFLDPRYEFKRIVYELPVEPRATLFENIIGGRVYKFRVQYRDDPDGEAGWIFDIAETTDLPVSLVSGIPIVSGLDLLYQYAHLGLDFSLVLVCKNGRDVPTFESLGVEDKVYLVRDEVVLKSVI